MTKNQSNDMLSNLPCVPFGRIDCAQSFRKDSKKARELGALPVLAGNFNLADTDFQPSAPMHIGWGALAAPGMNLPMLTFRLQVGAEMLYWLANPYDSGVWKMLDAWHAKGTIALAAQFEDKVYLASRDFANSPPMHALRQSARPMMDHPSATALFTRGAATSCVTGLLGQGATSDIEGVPRLARVLGCTIETCTTPRIQVPHEVALVAACDMFWPPAKQ